MSHMHGLDASSHLLRPLRHYDCLAKGFLLSLQVLLGLLHTPLVPSSSAPLSSSLEFDRSFRKAIHNKGNLTNV